MSRTTQSRASRARLVIVLGYAALIAAIWAIVLERVSYEHREAEASTFRQNSNLALAIEEHTVSVLKAVEQALFFLQHERVHDGRIITVGGLVADGHLDETFLAALNIVDASGQVLKPDGGPGPISMADRDYFAFHRDSPYLGMHVGKPVTGRLSGRQIIPVSRRVEGPDGSFGGVYLAELDASYLINSYRRFDVGQGGLVALVGLDGVARSTRVGEQFSYGDDMTRTMLLEHAARASAGSYVSDGSPDGVTRHVSYRAVAAYPLVVQVGTSAAEVRAALKGRERAYFLAAALVSGSAALLAAGLLYGWGRRARAAEIERRADAQHRATFDQPAIGIAHADLQGRFIKVNAKLASMLGYAREELLARSYPDVTHPDDIAAGRERLRGLLSADGTASLELEKRFLRKDGSELWAATVVSVARTPEGAPDYLIAMVADITKRKQTEEKLHEQLDEMRRFQAVTVDRELRMIELKRERDELKKRLAA